MRALLDVSTLEEKTSMFFSETSISDYPLTRRRTPEALRLQLHSRKKKTENSYVVKIPSNLLVHRRTFDNMEGADILTQSVAISRCCLNYTGQ
jgi:hypothetical protein